MKKYRSVFKELQEIFSDKKLNELTKLVKQFRLKQEKFYGWKNDKECFKNTCQDITKRLVDYLNKHKYKAKRVGGYYQDVSDDFSPDTSDWDYEDIEDFENNFNNTWKHWWVEVNNLWIVDVTADQFHPNEEDDYRVIITNIKNRDYK